MPTDAAALREIRLHGRGGQGTVKASEIIVYAAVKRGFFANSIPYFGFERRGAPVSAFVRISEEPIRPKTQVYHPGCVVVMDETLLNAVDVFEGMRGGGVLVFNTKRTSGELTVPACVGRVAGVDATGLSLDLLGRAVPNTVMLGAFCRATGWVDVEEVAQRAAQVFGAENARAVRQGYELTQVRETGHAVAGRHGGRGPGGRGGAGGAEWPHTGRCEAPVGSDLYIIRTGDWRSHRPVWDKDKCNGCGLCLMQCPVGAIGFSAAPGAGRRVVQVDLTYCKGCGICAHECPRGAVAMVEEGVKGP